MPSVIFSEKQVSNQKLQMANALNHESISIYKCSAKQKDIPFTDFKYGDTLKRDIRTPGLRPFIYSKISHAHVNARAIIVDHRKEGRTFAQISKEA